MEYEGRNVLAPMVRTGSLPFRLMALQYGADIVYSEEVVAKGLLKCERFFDEATSTWNYFDPTASVGKNMQRRIVLQSCARESGRNVLQLGASDSVSALKAAELAARDFTVVDINMGCPKHFSVHAGMGAGLLKTPEIAADIIQTLRRNLPVPISCKIRLLDTPEKTVEFARQMEAAGVIALAVHGRHVADRPRVPAKWDGIKSVAAALKIPVIANGDIWSYDDFQRIRDETGAAAAMAARGAQWNPSIFRKEGRLSLAQVKKDFLTCALEWANVRQMHNGLANTKFIMGELVANGIEKDGSKVKSSEGTSANTEHKAILKMKSTQDIAAFYGVTLSNGAGEKTAVGTDHQGSKAPKQESLSTSQAPPLETTARHDDTVAMPCNRESAQLVASVGCKRSLATRESL